MEKPVLVIMAAGMGSRYGGLKQIDPIDNYGNIIMDYSIYDAKKAGFEKVVFIIKKEDEEDFMAAIGNRIGKQIEVAYAFQNLNDLPDGYEVPEGRKKPWGTAQAVMAIRNVVNGPFAVINADDYYGADAFKKIYNYLITRGEDNEQCAMIGYVLKNTLTDHGHVARGICVTDEKNRLIQIEERTKIIKTSTGAAFTEDDGDTWTETDPEGVVSMNFWGFPRSVIDGLAMRFSGFLEENLSNNPMKCEYLLPTAIGQMLNEGQLMVNVLQSDDKWYGVTYKEDKAGVVEAVQELKDSGVYPQSLW